MLKEIFVDGYKSHVNGKGDMEYNSGDNSLLLKDLTVIKTEGDYQTTITTDIRENLPEMKAGTHSEYLNYALIADNKVKINGGSSAATIDGDVYSGTVRRDLPGASPELIHEAGLYADRMSVNIEIPNEKSLQTLAPEKDFQSVFTPMRHIQQGVLESAEERKKYRSAPRFAPAGQSTQMIIGATPDSDKDILRLSSALYQRPTMKRVYYSGFVPVNAYDNRLPQLKQPPLVRENRLYQADWLLRFYQFKVDEIVDDSYPDLDLEIDPKLAWALRHPEKFPVDINRADYELLLRIPGLGVKSAKMIIVSRRYGKINGSQLKKMGVVLKKAQYFITCNELPLQTVQELRPERVRQLLIPHKGKQEDPRQLKIIFE